MAENRLPVAIAKGLLASIPIAGPIGVELVNREIQKKRQERLNQLEHAVSEVLSSEAEVHNPSVDLQYKVLENSLSSDEAWRISAYANLLFRGSDSVADLRREILADFVADLRVYDIWILLNIDGNQEKLNEVPKSISDAIYNLESQDQNVAELRPYSLNKLVSMGLVEQSETSGSYSLQPLGRDLTEFI